MSNPPSSSRTRQGDDDVTWLDFLRTAGGTAAPAESSSVASNSNILTDRKRRHAGSSPERRGYPYPVQTSSAGFTGRRPSGMSASTSAAGAGAPQAGSSRDNAIDLTSPPRHRPAVVQRGSSSESLRAMRARETRNHPMRNNSGSVATAAARRRESDATIVLPKWQPDADVTRCPVCQTEFHFFYRKHHCRKCGRVVCTACSPHRITIPRQYVVQPPTVDGEDNVPGSSTVGSSATRNLGGGEVVRVCNPCVPDPWTPAAAVGGEQVGTWPQRVENARSVVGQQYRPVPPPPPFSHHDSGRARSHSHQPAAPSFSRSVPHHQAPPNFGLRDPYSNRAPPPVPPNASRSPGHRYSHSTANAHMPPVSPPHLPAPPPRPRREVREEDECPVCGTELPPGEALRETHIQACITSRFSGTPSSAPPIQAQAPPPPEAPTGRPRTTSYRPRGMAIYRATEKDCVNDDGEAQECVICFEEFQPGDEMGRMECLCKFHRTCIRRWWETKGAGSCPTHQLHD